MKEKPLFVVVALGLLVSSGCGKGGKSWYAPYELEQPESWERDLDTTGDLAYVSPSEGKDDTFREFVRVDYASPPGRSGPSDIAANFFSRNKERFPSLKQLSESTDKLAGKSAHKVIFSYEEDGRTLKAVAYFINYKATGLAVQGIATEKTFARYEKQFDQIAKKLVLKK